MDQSGKGPRMILRYPTAASEPHSTTEKSRMDDILLESKGSSSEEDLFFRLSGRQMAKLFRPKAALCGQPITLTVGGTYFCCSAVLMNDTNSSSNETTDETETQNSPLVLFSVVVALTLQRESASPVMMMPSQSTTSMLPENESIPAALSDTMSTSPTYRSIRRVHASLARLCRVLEREERRCRYVSCQTQLFERIRSEILSAEEPTATSTTKSSSNVITPPVSALPSPTSQNIHRRSNSFNFDPSRDLLSSATSVLPGLLSETTPPPHHRSSALAEKLYTQELAQVLLETVMAAPPTKVTLHGWDMTHQGNLARELAQVYHALAAPGSDPADSMSVGQESIIYINGHIAIAIEALTSGTFRSPLSITRDPRPYETLLLPNGASTLDSILTAPVKNSSDTPSARRLEQFVLALHPQKSLQEVAIETWMPLAATLDLAADLMHRGLAVVSPVLSYAQCCVGPPSIAVLQNMTLPFYQAFPTSSSRRHLLEWFSILTVPGRTLGQARSLFLYSTDPSVVELRNGVMTTEVLSTRRRTTNPAPDLPLPSDSPFSSRSVVDSSQSSEEVRTLSELFFQIVTWLCAHGVLVVLSEYLVRVANVIPNLALPSHGGKVERKWDEGDDPEEWLLAQKDCWTGRISIPACSWKTGLDESLIRALVARHPRTLRIVCRAPVPGDDDWSDAV
jgi:hypothetical protein